MFRHVVLFVVRDDVSDHEVVGAVDMLRALGHGAAATSWRIELSPDERKGRVIVQDAVFPSSAAFEAFRASPAHRAAGLRMSGIADWINGDYVI